MSMTSNVQRDFVFDLLSIHSISVVRTFSEGHINYLRVLSPCSPNCAYDLLPLTNCIEWPVVTLYSNLGGFSVSVGQSVNTLL